jgi:alpha-1,2-mannosyltransferase
VRLTGTDRRWAVAGIVAALVAVVAFNAPGPNMLDLQVYRVGGRAVLDGADLYTVTHPGTGLLFTYPVFAALLFVPFTLLPWIVARVLLTLASLAALFLIVHLTVRQVRGTSSLAWSVPLSVAAIAAHPVWETFTFGQVNLILAALVLIDVLALRSQNRWRGLLVGIAAGIKLVPGIFIVWFLLTGQRRAALVSFLTTVGTVAVGFAVQPGPAWDFWTHHAFNPERTGGIAYVTNQSILGASARLLRDPHPPRALTLALSAVIVVVALWLARRLFLSGDIFMSITVTALGSLLASPVSWSHHWVWAIPVLGTLVLWAARHGSWRWWVVGIVTAIVVTGPMQFMPKEDLRELHHTLPQQVVANIYFLLALAYLGWAAVRVLNARDRSLTASPESAPTR